jgi:3-deoxy-D-manno-octulosonic-acid transferase
MYNIVVDFASFVLKIVALFHKKTNLFVKGRTSVFSLLKSEIAPEDQVFWFHCASLGEFEQGRPVMEQLKKEFSSCKIVLTFFSPSGYEVRKNYKEADVVCYLPLDTFGNARKFVKTANPAMAVFVKYEFWPNYLEELKKQKIPTILVSGIFRKKQVFFQWYGAWIRKALQSFSHFFVQDENSSELLKSMGFGNIEVIGDTRFDRVYEILKGNNQLDFRDEFTQGFYTLVAGSTWKEDEDLLIHYINNVASSEENFVIAPHNVHPEGIARLKEKLKVPTVLYSQKENKNLGDFQVFIIDTIGILTKIYSVADVAYVGGGYTKSGIHNILEPAAFGIPVVIGPNYKKFKEAEDLIALNACVTTANQEEVNHMFAMLKTNRGLRRKKGEAALCYIEQSLGASDKITAYIQKIIEGN